MFCRSLSVVLRFPDSDYPFGISKLFLFEFYMDVENAHWNWRGYKLDFCIGTENMKWILTRWISINCKLMIFTTLDFLDRGLLFTRKLLNQGFLPAKWKSLLRKFYGRHCFLVNRYGIFVSQMTTDMFHLT
jgi:hypothetical protein